MIGGFPAIKFWKAGPERSPIDYEGASAFLWRVLLAISRSCAAVCIARSPSADFGFILHPCLSACL